MSEDLPANPVPARAIDVTGDFVDLAPEDRVYRDASGYLVKVKVILSDETSRMGAEVFQVTGAIIGADGKALRREDGKLAVYDRGRTHHQLSHAMSDPVVGLEAARLACVDDTVRAERHHQMIKAAAQSGEAGVVTARMQADRKAAEAARAEVAP